MSAIGCGFVQIAVAIVPGLDDRDRDPVRRELETESVGESLEAELRDRVGAHERQRAPSRDRAHQDDAPVRRPQRGKTGLRDGELTREFTSSW